jgi:hypothetical protein
MTVAEQRLLELLIYDRELRDAILPQLEETDYEMLATASGFSRSVCNSPKRSGSYESEFTRVNRR